jgi:hypothetical protein
MSQRRIRRSGETLVALGWATAAPGLADRLRRGAWYPVIKDSGDGEVVLEVDLLPMRVDRADLHIRPDRPEMWTIVTRTGVMRPTLTGVKVVNRYAVCPDCLARQEFEGEPETIMCTRCRRASKVDWSATY